MDPWNDITDARTEANPIAALEAKIQRLEAVVARLERREPTGTDRPDDPPAADPDDGRSRRSILRVAAVAATGAVAGAVGFGAAPAAALPVNLELQNTSQLTVAPTQVTCKTTLPGAASFAFATGIGLAGAATSPSYPCALGGWTADAAQPTGVYGYWAASEWSGTWTAQVRPSACAGSR